MAGDAVELPVGAALHLRQLLADDFTNNFRRNGHVVRNNQPRPAADRPARHRAGARPQPARARPSARRAVAAAAQRATAVAARRAHRGADGAAPADADAAPARADATAAHWVVFFR